MFDEQNQPDYSYNPNSEWEQRHRPMPSAQPESSGFITASLVMGILSLIFLFSGLSPFFGGLGILFAILSRKGQGSLPKQSRIGMGLSIGGFVLGILIWIGLCLMVLNLMKDPSFREEFLRQYNAYYNGVNPYNNPSDDSSVPYSDEPDGPYSDEPKNDDGDYDDYYDGYYDDYDDFYDYYGDYFDDYNGSSGNGYDGGSFNPFRYTPGSGSVPDAPDTMNYGGQT